MHEALEGPAAGSHAAVLGRRGSVAKKVPSELCIQVEPGVEGEPRERGLGLRLDTVDLGRVRVVEFEAEGRKLRVADDDLEVAIVVVKAVDLRAEVAVEAGRFQPSSYSVTFSESNGAGMPSPTGTLRPPGLKPVATKA